MTILSTEAATAFKLREIELTYQARRPRHGRSEPSQAALRCADLARFLSHVYGPLVSDDDAGRDDAFVMLHHLAWRGENRVGLRWWLGRCCPWMGEQEAVDLAENVIAEPRKWTADELGKRLGLTDKLRTGLGITTIGAADVSKEERLARRKAKDRDYQHVKRRAAGAKPRAQYEAESLSKTQPWKALGIVRKTWERRRKSASNPVSQVHRQQASESSQSMELRQVDQAATRKSAERTLPSVGRGNERPETRI
jgi:hypothetical protein